MLVELFGCHHPLWGDLQPFQIMFKVGVEQKLPEISHLLPEIQVIVQICLESKRTTAVKLLKSLVTW